jgi:hypothetical protein
MGHHFQGACCMPYGHHHRTLEEEKEMLESYKRDLEDEISRTEARIKKISK